MRQNASTSAAPDAHPARTAGVQPAALGRTRLIAPLPLAGLALFVALALVLLYPREQLLERLSKAPRNDPLTTGYLVNLHRVEPGDANAALMLAEARIAQGERAQALALLAPIERADDPVLRRRAMLLHASVLASADLGAYLRNRIGEQWSRGELLTIAALGATTGDAALRAQVYTRLAATERDPLWFARTAEQMLGEGDYRLSAQLWFAARKHASAKNEAREYFLAGVRTLQSGNLLAEAIEAAERNLGDLADDEQTMLAVVRLALAAGRPDIAQRHMKRLIWPAAAPGFPGLLERVGGWLFSSAHAQAGSAPATLPPGMRRYDEAVYTFAFDVFLANGNVEDAYRVAQAAVLQRPDDLAWREKLARAAEWSRHPAEALAQWLHLAQRTGSEEAWQAVLRIAPGLSDDAALFAATKRYAERRDARREDLVNLAALYERLGRPREGLAWFEQHYRAHRQILSLELAADLADRAGLRDKAIALNLEHIAAAGPNLERMVRAATLMVLAGRFRAAHDLLRQHRSSVTPEAEEYWDLLGDLAWRLQEDDTAIDAYRVLSERSVVDAGDLGRLVVLLRDRHPEEAAKFAELGYRRLRTPGLLITALEILWDRKDLLAMKRLYAELGPADEAAFAKTPFFFSLRAQYLQAQGDLKAARADLERAAALAPQDLGLRTTLLWLLLESKDTAALRKGLLDTAREAEAERELWAVHASGWSALRDTRRALAFYLLLVRDKPEDYLWLMGYADALEQDGQAGAAGRVRRHAWNVVRAKLAQETTIGGARDAGLRETAVRLALSLAPADAALAVVRDVVRRDFAPGLAPNERARDAATRELILSWALSNEQHANAKAWIWQQYGRTLAAPGWAEAAIALADNDPEAAERVLAERPAELSPGDRVEAARLSRQTRLAQTLAFEAQEGRPHDDALHLQLADTLLEGANRLMGGAARTRRGVLESRPRDAQALVWLTPRLRLSAQWREASQSSRDETVLTAVPASDREVRATLRQLLDTGWVEAGIGERRGFATQTQARARLYTQWSRSLSSLFTVARNERTLDSTALSVAGSKDELSARVFYSLSKSEYVSGYLWNAGYFTQNRVRLGAGSGFETEVGHRVRIEYPDVTLRLTTANLRFSEGSNSDTSTAVLNPLGVVPGADFFVPRSSRLVGLGIGFGESIRESYSRALRPYGGLTRTSSSLAGSGYNATLGAGASLFGSDQLSLYWLRARGGGASGDAILEYGLRYEYFFDRF